MRRTVVTVVGALLFLAAVACGGSTSGAPDGTVPPVTPSAGRVGSVPGTTGVTVAVAKEVLSSEVAPPGAPDRTLTLMRYTIAPAAVLAPHIHPGVQLAAIESGTLTYTVVSGTATVTRADGTNEAVAGPATTELHAGDAVTENGDMVHFGANRTTEPVVILATLLTQTGLDLAVTVSTTAPPPATEPPPVSDAPPVTEAPAVTTAP